MTSFCSKENTPLHLTHIELKIADQGKLAPNREGPYHLIVKTENKAYILETLLDKAIPWTWNVNTLKNVLQLNIQKATCGQLKCL